MSEPTEHLPSGRGRPHIAVIGASTATYEEIELAEKTGIALASAGALLICGGLGGVMEAACRGAKEFGGTTVGILPGADRSQANPFVDVAIATGIGEARNAIVVSSADAVVAVGGEFGTLSEIALALRAGKPVIGLDTWELHRHGVQIEGVMPAEDPVEAVALALLMSDSEL